MLLLMLLRVRFGVIEERKAGEYDRMRRLREESRGLNGTPALLD